MKKIFDRKTYPANVIYYVFGTGDPFYFDPVDCECAIEDIMRREFPDEDRKVFYAIYKDGKTKGETADELKKTKEEVSETLRLTLRRLRHPKRAKPLQEFCNTVEIFGNDGRLVSELLEKRVPFYPAAVVENGHVRAFVLDVAAYDRLTQQAEIAAKWERETKQKVRAESDMFRKALRLIIDKGSVSTMLLQLELQIGYAHASQIISEMEEYKFISPHIPEQKREIYITEEQYDKLFGE